MVIFSAIITTSLWGVIFGQHEKYDDQHLPTEAPNTLIKDARYFLSWPIIIEVIRLIFFFVYNLESPQYYMEKKGVEKSHDEVTNILKKIYVKEDIKKAHEL